MKAHECNAGGRSVHPTHDEDCPCYGDSVAHTDDCANCTCIAKSYGGSFSAAELPWPESAVREVAVLNEVIADLVRQRDAFPMRSMRELLLESRRALRQAVTCIGGCDERPECVHVMDIAPILALLNKHLGT